MATVDTDTGSDDTDAPDTDTDPPDTDPDGEVEEGGCGCASTGRTSAPALLVLLLAPLWTRYRDGGSAFG